MTSIAKAAKASVGALILGVISIAGGMLSIGIVSIARYAAPYGSLAVLAVAVILYFLAGMVFFTVDARISKQLGAVMEWAFGAHEEWSEK